MTCDKITCQEYSKSEVSNEIYFDPKEFITDLQHKKCKVIQLVREQIYKFEMAKWEPYSIESRIAYKSGLGNGQHAEQEAQVEDISTFIFPSITPQVTIDQSWIKRTVHQIRNRINLILAAFVIGIVVWMSLIYGVILGISVCGSNRLCVSSFKYSHAKHSVF